MKGLADGDLGETDGSLGTLREEREGAVKCSLPTDATVHTLGRLLSSHSLALGQERAIKAEMQDSPLLDTHLHHGFCGWGFGSGLCLR